MPSVSAVVDVHAAGPKAIGEGATGEEFLDEKGNASP